MSWYIFYTNYMPENQYTQTYYISRHLRSCNNIIDDKHMNILNKYAEPSLSLWGTITGLAFDRKIEGAFQDKVYVSCLVRTWFTAIIQYLPYCQTNTINLVVSPYIKEKHNKYLKQADLGNIPIPFPKQIQRLQDYFAFLNIIKQYLNKVNSQNNIILLMKENINKILQDNKRIKIVFIHKPNNIEFELKYQTNKLILLSLIDKSFNPYIEYKIKGNDFLLKQQQGGNISSKNMDKYIHNNLNSFIQQKNSTNKINNIQLDVSPTPLKIEKIKLNNKKVNIYTDYFGKEGIFLFIDWIQNYVNDYSSSIYVVAHSNIMQDILVNICQQIKNNKTINKKTLNECNNNLSVIRKQNIWELILHVENNLGNLSLQGVFIREGADPPNIVSVNNIDIKQEVSCASKKLFPVFSDNIENGLNPLLEEDNYILQYYTKFVKDNPKLFPSSNVYNQIDKNYKSIITKIIDKEEDKKMLMSTFFTNGRCLINYLKNIKNIKDEYHITLYNKDPPNLYLLLTKMLWYAHREILSNDNLNISEIKSQLNKDIHRTTIYINGIKFQRDKTNTNSNDIIQANNSDILNETLINVSQEKGILISLDIISLINIIILQNIIQVIGDMITGILKLPLFSASNYTHNIIMNKEHIYTQTNILFKILDINNIEIPIAYINVIFQVNILKKTYLVSCIIYSPEYIEKNMQSVVPNPNIPKINTTDKSQPVNGYITETSNTNNQMPSVLAGLGAASVVGTAIGTLFLTGILGGKTRNKNKHNNKQYKKRKTMKKRK